jgi:hypothetical protein
VEFTADEVDRVRSVIREQAALIVAGEASAREGAARIAAAAAAHGDAALIESPLWEDVAPFFLAIDEWDTSEAIRSQLVPARLRAKYEDAIFRAARDYVEREH